MWLKDKMVSTEECGGEKGIWIVRCMFPRFDRDCRLLVPVQDCRHDLRMVNVGLTPKVLDLVPSYNSFSPVLFRISHFSFFAKERTRDQEGYSDTLDIIEIS